MGVGDFQGARTQQNESHQQMPLSGYLNVYVGTTEAHLANPNPDVYRRLWIHVETDAIQMRPGNYTELTADSTSDVDATADTIVITGVESRMDEAGRASGDGSTERSLLVFGPVQLSTPDLLPTGLSADTNYWIAKPFDAGVGTDEVAFYTSLAAALNAGSDNTDGRVALTAAIGTTNFAGMGNNALGAIHTVAVSDGYASLHVGASPEGQGGYVCFAAPKNGVSVIGSAAGSNMYYWWS